jgi:hypothetical protein
MDGVVYEELICNGLILIKSYLKRNRFVDEGILNKIKGILKYKK